MINIITRVALLLMLGNFYFSYSEGVGFQYKINDEIKTIVWMSDDGRSKFVDDSIPSLFSSNQDGALALKVNSGENSHGVFSKVESQELLPWSLIEVSFLVNSDVSIKLNSLISSGPSGRPPVRSELFSINQVDIGKWIYKKYSTRLFHRSEKGVFIGFLLSGSSPVSGRLQIKDIRINVAKEPESIKLFSPQSGYVYDDDKQPLLIRSISNKLIDYKVWLEDEKSQKIKGDIEKTKDDEIFKISFNEKYKIGVYKLNLESKDGKTTQFDFKVIKKEDPILTINDSTVYLHEKPYFPIGIYHAGSLALQLVNKGNNVKLSWNDKERTSVPGNAEMGLPELTYEAMFKSLKEKGFDLIHYTIVSEAGQVDEDFKNSIKSADLNFFQQHKAALKKDLIHNRSNILWYAKDEANTVSEKPNALDLKKKIESEYNENHELDKKRLVLGVLGAGRFSYSSSIIRDFSVSDIFAPDSYDIGGPNDNLINSYYVMKDVTRHLKRNDPRRALWFVPQTFCGYGPYDESKSITHGWSNGWIPSYDQLRCQVYLAIAGGAKGIIHYAYVNTDEGVYAGMPKNPRRKFWYLPETQLWDKLPLLHKEIRDFQEIWLLGSTLDDGYDNKESIVYRLIQHKDDKYLLLVNSGPKRSSKTFSQISPSLTRESLIDSVSYYDKDKNLYNIKAYGVGLWKLK